MPLARVESKTWADDDLERAHEISAVTTSCMAKTEIVKHGFTLPKPEVCPMGLVVGWEACATVGRRELGMVVRCLVRQCCGILIKRLPAKQEGGVCDATSQVPSVYRSFIGMNALSWN
jgi:hypothetical protein